MNNIDNILNGDFYEIEDAVVVSETSKETLPELVGIDDTEIQRVYPELKLNVSEIHIDKNTQFEATEYTKKLSTLSKHIDKVRIAKKKELEEPIQKMEQPYKDLKKVVDKLLAKLKSNLTTFQLEQKRIAEEKAEKERLAKQAELERIEKEKQDLVEAVRDSEDEEEKQAYKDAQAELEQKSNELQESEIVPENTNVQAMGATAYIKMQPKYEVIDPDKVPRQYCDYSKGKIWKAVQSGVKEIPGVKIWEEPATQIR